MKIKIIGVDDPLILKELAVINQGFFDEWAFVTEKADLEIELDGAAEVTKNAYLARYLQALTKEFGRKQPWGLLNGMRPNKLVHSLKKRGRADAEITAELQNTYLVQDEKMNLLLAVANHQLQVVPDLHHLEKEVSVYIGIPFCPTRCAYCTFAAYAYQPHKKWVAPFLTALLEEIKLIGQYLKAKKIPVTSVYLGGGTPTMLSADELTNVLSAITEHIATVAELREITVEAGRPDTLTHEKLQVLKDFCINRISINPQSFNQRTLDAIGRHHTTDNVIRTFKMAKELEIPNVNMDLIVGLPGESTGELRHSLTQVKALQPESLTVHMLAFKRKSEISNDRTLYTVAEKKTLQEMAQLTYDFAAAEGYVPYYLYRQKNIAGNLENIGYAKAEHASVYNILMMEEAQNVIGLGVGASSKFLIGESVHNPKDLRTYIEGVTDYVQKKLALLELSLEIEAQSFVYNPPPPVEK
ncbi:MAG: coproporphyrinogen dehydrogenase HemZ [Turicibacter sp.]|nr:coproporphyrinogen dehydrogenase HemZ [Turicibacter sp.]